MKNRLLVLLIVLALSAVSGLGIAAADGGTQLKAVTDGAVTLYASADAGAEVVAELDAYSVVNVLATDDTGAWFEVDAHGDTGWVLASDVIVMDLPLLAAQSYVNADEGATALYGSPILGEDYLMALDNGTVGTVLATRGQMVLVETAYGMGWSVATAWTAMPEGAYQAIVSLGRANEMGVFENPVAGAELAGTVPEGDVVWVMGAVTDEWVDVMGAVSGYALVTNLVMLPEVYVDAAVAGRAQPALFSTADFAAETVTAIDEGTTLVYIGEVDDFWTEVYHPMYGTSYIQTQNVGPMYYLATVGQAGSIVRQGPNDNTYNAVAQLAAGSTVIVKGKTDAGAWIQVVLPFDAVTYGYNGVEGWMRDYLFVDVYGDTDLDVEMLNVTE
ncbi:MAG: SH3 domain-containing protein [Anaerolineae bacterium]|nr:SH3 domain-containing protein [Anaerolineae bacterium]